MKKILTIALSVVMLFSIVACGNQTDTSGTNETDVSQSEQTTTTEVTTGSEGSSGNPSFEISLDGVTSLDELEARIGEQLANDIGSLNARWESLSAEIDTYEKYVANTDKISDFYRTIVAETEQMCSMLQEYSAAYARMILDSDMSADDKYKAIDGINDCLHDDACDQINDDIYDGILDDMNDY